MARQELSIPKSSLTDDQLRMITDLSVMKGVIGNNLNSISEAPFVSEQRGIFSHDNYQELFSLTGAFRVEALSQVGSVAYDYFTRRPGRMFIEHDKEGKESHFNLRGARYITASDPNLSVPQKLEIYRQDFSEGIEALQSFQELPSSQHLELAPILDYIKNAAVTLFNAYIQREKIGDYKLDDEHYQTNRSRLIRYMRKTISAYYLSLLDNISVDRLEGLYNAEDQQLMLDVASIIDREFKDYIFSSKFIVRPEATHPLSNLATAYLISQRYPEVDTVVGFPSGSTELTCVVAESMEHFTGREINMVLMPFSLHSIKQQFTEEEHKPDAVVEFIRHNNEHITDRNILLIDDNSSTGRTLQEAADLIEAVTRPRQIDSSVSESDIIRSRLDVDSPRRTHIASPYLYRDSIGILPVSRRIRPKYGLRELMESKQLASYYRKKAKDAKSLEERIKYEVYADGAHRPIDQLMEEYPVEEIIDNFHGTFLSNFYAIPVLYDGTSYPSVEHAYQRAKFNLDDLRNISNSQKEEIQEILRLRGYGRKMEDSSTLFSDDTVVSGIIKVVADRLRDFGFVRENWDDQRVDVMTQLLVQKFRDPLLAERLLETGDKLLIEGNDWNDTFWGVDSSSNTGRNMLGRLLMNIRDKIKSGSYH